MNEHELIWLAGFVDGDGCIDIIKTQNPSNISYCLRLQIGQKSRRVLDYIRSLVECGNVNKHSRNRDSWRFAITGDNACNIIKQLLPYLIVKKLEAQVAIQFNDYRMRCCKENPISEEEATWRYMHHKLLQYIKRHR